MPSKRRWFPKDLREGQPRYVVKLGDDGYYSKDEGWKRVPRSKATWMSHEEALRVASHLRQSRIGIAASVERL